MKKVFFIIALNIVALIKIEAQNSYVINEYKSNIVDHKLEMVLKNYSNKEEKSIMFSTPNREMKIDRENLKKSSNKNMLVGGLIGGGIGLAIGIPFWFFCSLIDDNLGDSSGGCGKYIAIPTVIGAGLGVVIGLSISD